ncbi:MAG TPA: amidase [Burkholderiaceae bacterium]|jgi:amidase/aspartyl-tRNA(Asn)/glutamyl-tRNA(Gln) amidotransferase subunit A|nr:amidase [Burkholderiaceae bacterium]
MTFDLIAAAQAIHSGAQRAEALLEASLARADEAAHSFIRRFDNDARATARRAPTAPLAGLAISVKDLFDVQGQPTMAGSLALSDAAPARADAPAVARLRAAGAALIGHTNLSEFAFSGVGINPHHGTPANVGAARVDATPRAPGGSTSGGASSVASGAAWAALGSDTGGSIRIPAALQGLVGFKSTARLVPTEGCIPLSTTLDTACAVTLSVRDAQLLHEVLAARRVTHAGRSLKELHLAMPTTLMLNGLDATVARTFERALATLRNAGARIDEVALPALSELSDLNAAGGFPAAESWAWHRRLLASREALYDPRVAQRIRRGEAMSAADYIDLLHARGAWIARMQQAMRGYDALLSPTVPIVAPPLQPLLADDKAFFATNALLLRNPAAINFLDGCALSLPCHAPDELPVGLMVWSEALADDRVLEVSLAIEAALKSS